MSEPSITIYQLAKQLVRLVEACEAIEKRQDAVVDVHLVSGCILDPQRLQGQGQPVLPPPIYATAPVTRVKLLGMLREEETAVATRLSRLMKDAYGDSYR